MTEKKEWCVYASVCVRVCRRGKKNNKISLDAVLVSQEHEGRCCLSLFYVSFRLYETFKRMYIMKLNYCEQKKVKQQWWRWSKWTAVWYWTTKNDDAERRWTNGKITCSNQVFFVGYFLMWDLDLFLFLVVFSFELIYFSFFG